MCDKNRELSPVEGHTQKKLELRSKMAIDKNDLIQLNKFTNIRCTFMKLIKLSNIVAERLLPGDIEHFLLLLNLK